METPEFPNNSMKAQKAPHAEPASEKANVTKVISGEAVRRKKPLGKRFREFFISSEDPRNVMEFLFEEHVLPGLRDVLFDSASAGLERKLYGDSSYRPGGRRRATGAAGNVMNTLTNYGAFSSGPIGNPNQTGAISRRARQTLNFGEVVVATKAEAEGVLDTMFEVLSKFEEVTVAEFMKMVGETPDFQAEKHGWTDLRGSRVVRAKGGGYTWSLPPTEELA